MSALNKTAYSMEQDNLIYDGKYPIDGKVISVKVDEGAGQIMKGQLIDFDNDEYVLHKESGTLCCIAAESVDYDEGDSVVNMEVYTSGSFKTAAVVSDIPLTEKDFEQLRSKNIILK